MNTAAKVRPAEIILTSVEGKVYATVNGVQVVAVPDKSGFIGKIDKALRAASIYRQTGYNFEAGAFIAEGQMLVG